MAISTIEVGSSTNADPAQVVIRKMRSRRGFRQVCIQLRALLSAQPGKACDTVVVSSCRITRHTGIADQHRVVQMRGLHLDCFIILENGIY